ncbi:hypothetical protein [Streptomyces sp. NPDC001068]|uniref:hypothetical protein n=1 Tax=Streptomyces sp. NPDC001068 TaxID=3364544 RepID=UPI003696BDD9
MPATDCVGFLDTGLPPARPKRRDLSPLAELLAQTLWPLADWKGDRARCERAAQAVARVIVTTNSATPTGLRASDEVEQHVFAQLAGARSALLIGLLTSREETRHLAAELAGARSALDHMRGAMSWLSGHDRQGLDHLAEANHESRGREAAVRQARRWAARARAAEASLERLNDWCDGLDETAVHVAGRTEPIRTHPVAAAVRDRIAGGTEEGPK